MLRSGALPSARRRAVAGLTAVGLASVALTGCTVEPPTPAPEPPTVAAVVSVAQERKILDRVSGVVEGTTKAGDAGSLAARLTGPALAMREAELDVAASGNTDALSDLSMRMQQLVPASDPQWPRTSYAITEQPPDQTTPTLMAFEQDSARGQYKLWGWVRLVPDIAMPRFAEANLGSAAVPEDDTSLKVTPRDAIKRYASVLSVDEDSKYAADFRDDYLRRLVRRSGETQLAAIEHKDGKGTFEVAYQPTKDPVKAVRTVDGGALVLAAMRSQETLTAEENWELGPLAPSAKALWGDAKRTNVMRIVYRDTVALYVPPAGSAEPISLLGHHRVPYAVSNS
ncbi:hypothetical protein GCM10017772_41340 [Promicromonospora soli]|uniref:DUF8094 domain-containing protein n=1 Tax=Promicromonospora soli TaxID=2035533 RepID=A0A919G5T1_9MICO|nr:hypothetical protein GCM10017772_41340 [Promicromonospora soli]